MRYAVFSIAFACGGTATPEVAKPQPLCPDADLSVQFVDDPVHAEGDSFISHKKSSEEHLCPPTR